MSRPLSSGSNYSKLEEAEGEQSAEVYELLDTLQEAKDVINVLSKKLKKFEDDNKEISNCVCPNCKQIVTLLPSASGMKKSALQNEILQLKHRAKVDRNNWESELIQMKNHVIKMKGEYEEMALVLGKCRKELDRLKAAVVGEKQTTNGLANDCRNLVHNLQESLQKNAVLEKANQALQEENKSLRESLRESLNLDPPSLI